MDQSFFFFLIGILGMGFLIIGITGIGLNEIIL